MDIEWIILADAAEAVNNKLYLLGGGWDRIALASPLPAVHPMAIAVAVSVPWNETNQLHSIEVELADQDGNVAVRVDGQLEVGRPPGMPLGQAQRVQMAMSLGFNITKWGTYAVTARIEGQEMKRVTFDVVSAVPGLAPHPRIAPPQ